MYKELDGITRYVIQTESGTLAIVAEGTVGVTLVFHGESKFDGGEYGPTYAWCQQLTPAEALGIGAALRNFAHASIQD